MTLTSSAQSRAEEPLGRARSPVLSVIVPAHDEASVIERCLRSLADGAQPGELEVVVVANGCTDDTADRARRALPSATVVELAEASKAAALDAGDRAATAFPRAYVDADVVVDVAALRAVAAALEGGPVRCAAPIMRVHLEDRPWFVRRFYRAFLALPYVREDLVGNGFYALSEAGRRRFDSFPSLTADDLFVRNLFGRGEYRAVAAHHFTMYPPRTAAGLLAIRQRTYRGNVEYRRAGLASAAAPTRRLLPLLRVASRRPLDLAVFLAVNAVARRRAGAAQGVRWERDDSARVARWVPPPMEPGPDRCSDHP